MTINRGSRSVWTMLVLPLLRLAGFIIGYAILAGVTPDDPDADATIRATLGPIIIINHLALFGLLVIILRRNGETLRDIGWSLRAPQRTRSTTHWYC